MSPILGDRRSLMGEVILDIHEECLGFDEGRYGRMATRILQTKGTV